MKVLQAIRSQFKDIREHRKIVADLCQEEYMKLFELYDSAVNDKNYENFKSYYKGRIAVYQRIETFHDIKMYNPFILIPYAMWNYGPNGKHLYCKEPLVPIDKKVLKTMDRYNKAKKKFQTKSKSHWLGCKNNHMRYDDIVEMALDMKAKAIEEGKDWREEYINNSDKIKLDKESRFFLEVELDVIPEKFQMMFMTLKELKNEYPIQLKEEDEYLYKLAH